MTTRCSGIDLSCVPIFFNSVHSQNFVIQQLHYLSVILKNTMEIAQLVYTVHTNIHTVGTLNDILYWHILLTVALGNTFVKYVLYSLSIF